MTGKFGYKAKIGTTVPTKHTLLKKKKKKKMFLSIKMKPRAQGQAGRTPAIGSRQSPEQPDQPLFICCLMVPLLCKLAKRRGWREGC